MPDQDIPDSNATVRILLVEDDSRYHEHLLRPVKQAVEELKVSGDYVVHSTTADALKALTDESWDLVVTDVGVDRLRVDKVDKTGLPVIALARDRNVPCIVVSDQNLRADDADYMLAKLRARRFFRKGFMDFDDYRQEVKNILGKTEGPAGRLMRVEPIFQARNIPLNERSVFVLMPFGMGWSGHVFSVLSEACTSFGFSATRADELYGREIVEDIWQGICASRLVIAETTGRNANVLYELGIAHTVGKETVLLAQTKDDIPFDLLHLRYVLYDTWDRYERLKRGIENTLSAIVGGRASQNLLTASSGKVESNEPKTIL
ncbi:MAG TPA: hypothetical protein VJH03_10515 [Blastocatellia bacterium]|nr:hypothetical protein [Blastocatellia bacterium]